MVHALSLTVGPQPSGLCGPLGNSQRVDLRSLYDHCCLPVTQFNSFFIYKKRAISVYPKATILVARWPTVESDIRKVTIGQ